ncbi:MAG: T9SS type A sorting domain-containing protein [bacterium]|nr:T9SS type A sorting domain-containing protein [bacterium]
MMLMLRRILRGPAVAVLLPLTAVLLLAWPERPAHACWNLVLQECFDQVPGASGWVWPFQSPPYSGRSWQRNPSPPNDSWGHQDRYFSTAMCPHSIQALWCIGGPPANDPEFDMYRPNYSGYVVYGPFNLSAAVEAQVSFFMYNKSEANGDSVYWGASLTPQLSFNVMQKAGGYSGIMGSSWQRWEMDLSNLRNMQTGDSVSLLGQSQVYVWWWFRANSNSTVNLGAFIDNVTIMWDDGGMDAVAWSVALLRPDSSAALEPRMGDTLMAICSWGTCMGGLDRYPPFRVRALMDTTVIYDTLVTRAWQGMSVGSYTASWVVQDSGEHTVTLEVDYLDSLPETNENNNTAQVSYHIEPPNLPPVFHWLTPSTDTLWADSTAVLRWECFDSLEVGLIRLYTDVDTLGCAGLPLSGGQRNELDGPDSLVWNTASLMEGRVYHPLAVVTDAVNQVCAYAPYPVVIRHGEAMTPPGDGLPQQFFLAQNYPNPFNPATELRFGLAEGGAVSLRVFDLLGREVAVLIHDSRPPGVYEVSFDGSGLPAGLYFYTMTTPEGTLSRKMMLLK